MNRIFLILTLFLAPRVGLAQSSILESPSLQGNLGTLSNLLPNNSISHIATQSNLVYIGTSKGLARTADGGASWESFRSVPQFVNDGIFSLGVRLSMVWVATGFNKPTANDPNQTVQTGSGYTYSPDNGQTWTHVPQPLDAANDSIVQYGNNRINFLPIIVPEQNVTFDLALTDSVVWIASWSSGIRRSTNRGQTWQRTVLPSDTKNSIAPTDALTGYMVDPRRNNNFLGFSVYAENDSIIWAGTAGGINKSTDGGISWTKFAAQNQLSHILGNWVIAIGGQQLANTRRIWCTNWKAEDNTEQFGVSYTEDGGRIWKNFLHGIKSYDFAFKDSIAYVATDEGIFRTPDGGNSWIQSGTITDRVSGRRITSKKFFAVATLNDTVYSGGGEGLVKTIDNATQQFGETWQILQTYRPVGNTSATYAYPNPFSPRQEVARIHYSTGGKSSSVTVEVFDFGMNRVRTIVKDAQRSRASEHDEIWDGKDDSKRSVANGVYFYRLTLSDGEPSWGKMLVLQ